MGIKRSRLVLERPAYKNLCQSVFKRDGWKCRLCKRRSGLHAHHIVFRSHGGDDADWNLITLCHNCHDAIHNRWLVIRPGSQDQTFVDANKPVQFQFINGWVPGKKVA